MTRCFSAENMVPMFFPRLCGGHAVNGKIVKLVKNNDKDIYAIDWAITVDGIARAWLDSEHKESGWEYPEFSVAIHSLAYNCGRGDVPVTANKVVVYRLQPDKSYWLAVKDDYKEAGIVTGRTVIQSKQITRKNIPRGLARPPLVYSFPRDRMIFGEPLKYEIENFVIDTMIAQGAI